MTDERKDDQRPAALSAGLNVTRAPGRWLGLAIGLLLSGVWLALVGVYVTEQIGWENLRWILPHELALILAGVSGPLVVLWLVIHFLLRGSDLRVTAAALQRELQKLTYPDETAEAQIRNLSEALQAQNRLLSEAFQSQSQQLAEASKETADQIEKLQASVAQYAADLKEKTQLAADEVGEIRRDLRAQVDEVIAIAGEAAARAKSLRGALSQHSTELAKASDRVSAQVSEIGDVLGHDARLLQWLSTRMNERARKVRDVVETEEPAAAGKAEPVRLHAPATASGTLGEIAPEEAPAAPVQSVGASSK